MSLRRRLAKSRFDVKRRIRFYRKMIQFAKDGISLDRCVEIIHRRYKQNGEALLAMTSEWLAMGAREGMSMRVAKGWIPDDELTLIVAGESANDLRSGFVEAEKLAVTSLAIRREVISAIGTPLFSVALLIVLMLGFRLWLGPMLIEMAPVEKWPSHSRTLYGLTGIIHGYWWIFLGAGVLTYMTVAKSLPNLTGNVRATLDNIPPWSIYRVVAAASFMIGISGLLKQGKDMDSALREYGRTSSPYMKKYIRAIQTRKSMGISEAEAMNVGLLDKETAGDIADVGASTGIDEVMRSLGDDSLDKAISNVRSKAIVMKYAITFVVGFFVFWIFASFMTTSFEAAQAQKRSMSVVR